MDALSFQIVDSIAVVTLDQPGGKVNILSRSMWSDLAAVIEQLSGRSELHGAVFESAKPGIFIAGADLKELADVPGPDHQPVKEFIQQGLDVLESIEALPIPTISCIDGAALGGGLEVALACDFRIAGTNPKTRLGFPEITLGLIPGWGGTQRLPRIIGLPPAISQLLNNVQFDAAAAKDHGLVSDRVDSQSLRKEACQLIENAFATRSWLALREKMQRPIEMTPGTLTAEIGAFRRSLGEQSVDGLRRPAAIALLDVLEKGLILPLTEAIRIETDAFVRLAGSPEARQLIKDFFQSRGK